MNGHNESSCVCNEWHRYKVGDGVDIVFKWLVFFKAVEDEGGDPENIQIQLPTDASARKSGKVKGN